VLTALVAPELRRAPGGLTPGTDALRLFAALLEGLVVRPTRNTRPWAAGMLVPYALHALNALGAG